MYRNNQIEVAFNMSIIIIIIIKRGYTPYQSEDPSTAIPSYRQIENKRENSRRL